MREQKIKDILHDTIRGRCVKNIHKHIASEAQKVVGGNVWLKWY